MVSIDLKDVHLQVPVHPDSCHFTFVSVLWWTGRFYLFRRLWRFKKLYRCDLHRQLTLTIFGTLLSMFPRSLPGAWLLFR